MNNINKQKYLDCKSIYLNLKQKGGYNVDYVGIIPEYCELTKINNTLGLVMGICNKEDEKYYIIGVHDLIGKNLPLAPLGELKTLEILKKYDENTLIMFNKISYALPQFIKNIYLPEKIVQKRNEQKESLPNCSSIFFPSVLFNQLDINTNFTLNIPPQYIKLIERITYPLFINAAFMCMCYKICHPDWNISDFYRGELINLNMYANVHHKQQQFYPILLNITSWLNGGHNVYLYELFVGLVLRYHFDYDNYDYYKDIIKKYESVMPKIYYVYPNDITFKQCYELYTQNAIDYLTDEKKSKYDKWISTAINKQNLQKESKNMKCTISITQLLNDWDSVSSLLKQKNFPYEKFEAIVNTFIKIQNMQENFVLSASTYSGDIMMKINKVLILDYRLFQLIDDNKRGYGERPIIEILLVCFKHGCVGNFPSGVIEEISQVVNIKEYIKMYIKKYKPDIYIKNIKYNIIDIGINSNKILLYKKSTNKVIGLVIPTYKINIGDDTIIYGLDKHISGKLNIEVTFHTGGRQEQPLNKFDLFNKDIIKDVNKDIDKNIPSEKIFSPTNYVLKSMAYINKLEYKTDLVVTNDTIKKAEEIFNKIKINDENIPIEFENEYDFNNYD